MVTKTKDNSDISSVESVESTSYWRFIILFIFMRKLFLTFYILLFHWTATTEQFQEKKKYIFIVLQEIYTVIRPALWFLSNLINRTFWFSWNLPICSSYTEATELSVSDFGLVPHLSPIQIYLSECGLKRAIYNLISINIINIL